MVVGIISLGIFGLEYVQITETNILYETLFRTIYYIGFLLIIGWIIWWRIIQHYSSKVRQTYLKWGFVFQFVHLLGFISILFLKLSDGFTFQLSSFYQLGYLYYISFFAIIIGFFLLFKNQWFDLCWVLILVISKSLNGHPAQYEPVFYLAIFNSFHIIAATIWSAGLTFMILFWQNHRAMVKNFLRIFLEYTSICMIMLAISGSILAYQYVPDFHLFLQPWGLLLLFKLIFVCAVILIGYKMRSLMKEEKGNHVGIWLHVELLFMLLIIMVVSTITNIYPIFY